MLDTNYSWPKNVFTMLNYNFLSRANTVRTPALYICGPSQNIAGPWCTPSVLAPATCPFWMGTLHLTTRKRPSAAALCLPASLHPVWLNNSARANSLLRSLESLDQTRSVKRILLLTPS